MRLIRDDAITGMVKLIRQGIKVDAIIADPPYGKTNCKWDSIIPFGPMWEAINMLIRPDGAIVIFGSEPFSSALRMSNVKKYRYDWVWNKKKAANFFLAKKQPMRTFENIMVFSNDTHKYYPIMVKRDKPRVGKNYSSSDIWSKGSIKFGITRTNTHRYPTAVLEFSNASQYHKVHPTQKPVELMEYLVKTYTKPGELVLDFVMGSGSTLVACQNTGRKGIGIEIDKKYFAVAKDRLIKNRDHITKRKD